MSFFDLFGAFLGGVLSFFSPCILPLLPGYLSFLGAQGGRKSLIKSILFFGLGFSAVFTALGALSTGIGQFLIYNKQIFSVIAGIIIIFLGLHVLGALEIAILYREKRLPLPKKIQKPYQAFLAGFAFAFGWTPCIGAVLAGILTLASQKERLAEGITLLSFYSLGLFIPFLAAGIFSTPLISKIEKYPKLSLYANRACGVLLIIMGILILTGRFAYISALFSLS
ncbi:MAG: cytochrome c biogenesis CcdA family protein [Deferribacteraceae bacterium]|jgi:cytochrome c-type biogenesis protein|nr:cytochrome c biogenesis CcdA family protein [Deferribacteraceae bacterium]